LKLSGEKLAQEKWELLSKNIIFSQREDSHGVLRGRSVHISDHISTPAKVFEGDTAAAKAHHGVHPAAPVHLSVLRHVAKSLPGKIPGHQRYKNFYRRNSRMFMIG